MAKAARSRFQVTYLAIKQRYTYLYRIRMKILTAVSAGESVGDLCRTRACLAN